MKHTLNSTNLHGFESQTTIASSTQSLKKLIILSTINSNLQLESNFIVKKDEVCLYRGSDLKVAIQQYNEI